MADLRTMLQVAASPEPPDDREIEQGWRRGRAQRRQRRLAMLAVPAMIGVVAVVAAAGPLDRSENQVVAGPPAAAVAPEGATQQQIPAPGVDDLSFGGGLAVRLVAGGGSITVEAAPAVLDDVKVTVDGTRVSVERRSPRTRVEETVVVTVATGAIRHLTLAGGVLIEGDLVSDDLVLDASGGINGTLNGSVDILDLEASGGVRLDLRSLAVEVLTAALSGGASVDVSAATIERVSLSGGSRLSHPSGAEVLDSDVDISSLIEQR